MLRFLIVLLCALLPLLANAECTIDPARMKFSLSSDALAIRNTLFLQLCGDCDRALVDLTDPTLIGRLEPPRFLPSRTSFVNPPYLQGTVVLAFLVDIDGSVHQVTVLESSGHKSLDAAALTFWKQSKFKTPAKLDGQPIRALMYYRMQSTVTHRDPGSRLLRDQ
jgi:TonB family protein